MATRMERYQVTIRYSEPAYARARGIDELVYSGKFEVTAADPDGAIMLATELFRDAQRTSSVSWAREIQAVSWRVIGTRVDGLR